MKLNIVSVLFLLSLTALYQLSLTAVTNGTVGTSSNVTYITMEQCSNYKLYLDVWANIAPNPLVLSPTILKWLWVSLRVQPKAGTADVLETNNITQQYFNDHLRFMYDVVQDGTFITNQMENVFRGMIDSQLSTSIFQFLHDNKPFTTFMGVRFWWDRLLSNYPSEILHHLLKYNEYSQLEMQLLLSIGKLRLGCIDITLTNKGSDLPYEAPHSNLTQFIVNSYNYHFPTSKSTWSHEQQVCLNGGSSNDNGGCQCPPGSHGSVCEFRCPPMLTSSDFQLRCNVSTWAEFTTDTFDQCRPDVISYYTHCLRNATVVDAAVTESPNATEVHYRWLLPDGLWAVLAPIYFSISLEATDDSIVPLSFRYPDANTTLFYLDSGTFSKRQRTPKTLHPFRQFRSCVALEFDGELVIQYTTAVKATDKLLLGCTTFATDEQPPEQPEKVRLDDNNELLEFEVSTENCNGLVRNITTSCCTSPTSKCTSFTRQTTKKEMDCRIHHRFAVSLTDSCLTPKEQYVRVQLSTTAGYGPYSLTVQLPFRLWPWEIALIAIGVILLALLILAVLLAIVLIGRRRSNKLERASNLYQSAVVFLQERVRQLGNRPPTPPRRHLPRPPDEPETEFEPTPVMLTGAVTPVDQEEAASAAIAVQRRRWTDTLAELQHVEMESDPSEPETEFEPTPVGSTGAVTPVVESYPSGNT